MSPRCLPITGVLRDRISNDVSQILIGPALVAMATKFDKKTGCNSARMENIVVPLAPSRGYLWVGYRMMSDKIPRPIAVAMATKFKTKSPFTRLV